MMPDVKPNYELVRARLRRTRKRRGLSLREAAAEIGDVSPSTLSRIERGTTPDLATLERLLDWLGLDRDVVFSSRPSAQGSTPRQVEVLLRADKKLDPTTAKTLARIFHAAYREMAGS
jgi:transcriptional regulator with XRE-family HTH domain